METTITAESGRRDTSARGRRCSREQERLLGRRCANGAVRRTWPNAPDVGVGTNREPIWPTGYTGSITHCAEYCAAVAMPVGDLVSIGIDVEPAKPLPPEVVELVCSGSEIARLRESLTGRFRERMATKVAFSAKESMYKAWYPLTHSWLDFLDVEILFAADISSFEVVLPAGTRRSNGLERHRFFGFTSISDGLIATAVLVSVSKSGDDSEPARPCSEFQPRTSLNSEPCETP